MSAESDIRTVVINVVKEMNKRGMKVRGELFATFTCFINLILAIV